MAQDKLTDDERYTTLAILHTSLYKKIDLLPICEGVLFNIIERDIKDIELIISKVTRLSCCIILMISVWFCGFSP